MKTLNPIQPEPKLPREVAAACAAVGRSPQELLAWALRDNDVVLILASGAKLRVKRRDRRDANPGRRA